MTDIIIRPKCKCHGVEMWFKKDKRRKTGGYFTCIIRSREIRKRSSKKYRDTPHGFMKQYLGKRNRQLQALRSKTILELEEIRKQRKELELVLRQK